MLHRHGHGDDKQANEDDQHAPLSVSERENLLREGDLTQGMLWSIEPLAGDPNTVHLRVGVTFKDGQRLEFTEDLANLYQPPPESPDARRIRDLRQGQQLKHAERIPKLQLATSAGSRVPVRYDAANRSRIVVDELALQKKAVDEYIARESKSKQQKSAAAPVTGPPWDVPAHCPNCGAPIDQATASKAQDPECRFCQEPIPVKPVARP